MGCRDGWGAVWAAFKTAINNQWNKPDAAQLAELREMFDAAEAALRKLGEQTEPTGEPAP